jgi:hypothetical protein
MSRRLTVPIRKTAPVGMTLVLACLLAAPGRAQEGKAEKSIPEGPAVSGPERIVQEQVEAYNRHDLEAFLKTYSPDVRVSDFPDTLRYTGVEAMRDRYSKAFERQPDIKVRIAKRIVQGDHVIDHEEVSVGGRQFTVAVIYKVEAGKIAAVWFLR